MTRETFVLTLEPLPDRVETVARLKSVLKTLLRLYRFKCISINGPGVSEALVGSETPASWSTEL